MHDRPARHTSPAPPPQTGAGRAGGRGGEGRGGDRGRRTALPGRAEHWRGAGGEGELLLTLGPLTGPPVQPAEGEGVHVRVQRRTDGFPVSS